MFLYFVRHGESYINRDAWDTLPTMDAGLTDKGHQQAAALRDWLRKTGAKADVLYTSTMLRARETAAYVGEALALEPTPDDRLRELATSYITGLAIEEMNLPRTFIDQQPHAAPFLSRTTAFEGVESWMHFRIRLAQFVDELAHKHLGANVYVVAHGGVVAAMFDNIFNVGPYRRCDVHNDNTGWSMFEYRMQPELVSWMLRHHNRTDHLT